MTYTFYSCEFATFFQNWQDDTGLVTQCLLTMTLFLMQGCVIDFLFPFIAMESNCRAFKQVTLPYYVGGYFYSISKILEMRFFFFCLVCMAFTFGKIKT
jgi:hypothetical protein